MNISENADESLMLCSLTQSVRDEEPLKHKTFESQSASCHAFDKADIYGCTFKSCDLSSCSFRNGIFTDVTFESCDLSSCDY